MTAYDDARTAIGQTSSAVEVLEAQRAEAVQDAQTHGANLIKVTQERDAALADLAACRDTNPPTPTRPWATTDRRHALGLYRQWESGEPSAVTSVQKAEAALGMGPARAVLRYAFADRIAASFQTSAKSVLAAPPRRLIFSLPLPAGVTLAQASTGVGMEVYGAAGQVAVDLFGDRADDLLMGRPLWEGNGSWYPYGYGVKGSATAVDAVKVGQHRSTQRRIHEAFMAPFLRAGVPLPAWDWNLSAGAPVRLDAVPEDLFTHWTVDAYQNWANRDPLAAEKVLRASVDRAKAAGVLWGIDETSTVFDPRVPPVVPAGGDDPRWWPMIARVADYAVVQGVLSHVVAFLSDPPGQAEFDVLNGHFPKSKAALMAEFD